MTCDGQRGPAAFSMRRAALTVLLVVLLMSANACNRPRVNVVPSALPTSTPSLTPTLTPTPSATPTPAFRFGTLRLRETFDSPQHTSLRVGGNQHSAAIVAGGGYTVRVDDANALTWSAIDSLYADAAISVDARLQRGADDTATGIIFRQQDENNFYFFGVTSDGNYALQLLQNGAWTSIIDWTDSPQIQGPGQNNHLRVEAAGERIRLYVNGTLLDEVSDNTFARGTVALAVHTFDSGDITARFDNLMIETP